jgi:peptide/nickel transport system substrate-binding protein/oligopeptide transport system substrate-binding protein
VALLASLSLALSACGAGDQQAVKVVVIGEPSSPFATGPAIPPAAQLLRGATAEGLVTLDADGKVVTALADRWIVTDDGQSYIFRLRDANWPDGTKLTGESVRAALRQAMAEVRGAPLALDLTAIEEVRAMAGRVVEIRLTRPMPDFLQLLAQPELGLTHHGKGTGPMALKREGGLAWLTLIPPEKRGLPMVDSWQQLTRPVALTAQPGAAAVAAFVAGKADVLLGGTFADFPRVNGGALGKVTARFDAVSGLFGLIVERDEGMLGIAQNREAIAMVIDRVALAARLGVPGFVPTTRIVAPGLDGDPGLVGERWADYDMMGRRTLAAQSITGWVKYSGKPAHLRIALPDGPGADLLAERLAGDLATIGVVMERVAPGAAADLRFIDAVARYPAPAWFFNQLACAVRHPCSPAADALAAKAGAADAAHAPALYAEAEREMAKANLFIPLGMPVRWSLGNANLPGFAPNRWGLHPLFPLANRSR